MASKSFSLYDDDEDEEPVPVKRSRDESSVDSLEKAGSVSASTSEDKKTDEITEIKVVEVKRECDALLFTVP